MVGGEFRRTRPNSYHGSHVFFCVRRDRVGPRAGATDHVRRAEDEIADGGARQAEELHENATDGVAARVRGPDHVERDGQVRREHVPVLYGPESETKTGTFTYPGPGNRVVGWTLLRFERTESHESCAIFVCVVTIFSLG